MKRKSYLWLLLCLAYCLLAANPTAARCCSPPPASPRPSRSPTFAPTRLPSAMPTRKPTRVPTASPTRLPSEAPTRRPSRSPTFAPSDTPTEEPTYMPSQPTSQPSSTPTTVTPRPSHRPSIVPSAIPSTMPTIKPTSNPTITPTRIPTNQPTESPTISFKPTAFPTLDPTPTPSRNPTLVPTASPSRSPSIRPSAVPTPAPSTVVATVVSLSLSQVLVNIDADSFLNSTTNAAAFKSAVADSVEGINAEDVDIESANDGARDTGRMLYAQKRFLRDISPRIGISFGSQAAISRSIFSTTSATTLAAPQVTIEYLIAFVMEELGYDNGTLAVRYAADSLSGAVEDGTFLESLRAAVLLLGADPALLNITSSSLTLISSSAVVLRSAAPSMQPTAVVLASAGSAAKFENWHPGVQAIVIIIVILVFLFLLVLTCRFMQRFSWFSTCYSQMELLVFGTMLAPRMHSTYLHNNNAAATASSVSGGDEEAPSQESTVTTNIINESANSAPEPVGWTENSSATIQRMCAEGYASVDAMDEMAMVPHVKRESRSLLFLSRHSEATEALMLDMEAAIYGAMPWLQHEKDEDFHPLTHGLESDDLPTIGAVSVLARRAEQRASVGTNDNSSIYRTITPPEPAADELSYCTAQLEVEGDEMSYFDCSPIVGIPPPFGVPVISRHCRSTQNMIAGIDALLSRAGLSLLEDQEEKEGEQAGSVPLYSSHHAPASPAPANFVRSHPATSAASLQYTDFLSTLIANSSNKDATSAPLSLEAPLTTDELELEREQENEQESHLEYAPNVQDSPEEKTDSSIDTTFHYTDALSVLIANNKAQNATQPARAPLANGSGGAGSDSPFVSLSAGGLLPSTPLAMEAPNVTTAACNDALAMENSETNEQPGTPPEEPIEPPLVMEMPEDTAALSPRSADDSELRALQSPSASILSGDCFSVASGGIDSRWHEGRDGSVITDTGSIYRRPAVGSKVPAAALTDGAGDGNVDDEVNVKVLRRVPSKRKASPRSPGENSAAFSKPRSPRSEFE